MKPLKLFFIFENTYLTIFFRELQMKWIFLQGKRNFQLVNSFFVYLHGPQSISFDSIIEKLLFGN